MILCALRWALPATPADWRDLTPRLAPATLHDVYRSRCVRPCQYVGFSFADTLPEMQTMRAAGAHAVGAGAMWHPLRRPESPFGVGARVSAHLQRVESVGQTFVASEPLAAVSVRAPTFLTTDSGCELALFGLPAGGVAHLSDKPVAARAFAGVEDNSWLRLATDRLRAGSYYLEMRLPVGRIGAWAQSGDPYADGTACVNREPVAGVDLELQVEYVGVEQARTVPDTTGHAAIELGPGLFGELDAAGLVTNFSVGNWNNGHFPYYPEWFYERFSDVPMLDQNGQPLLAGMFDRQAPWPGIESPAIVSGTNRFIDATVRALRDEAALLYWVMGGEALYATYSFPGRWTDYSENAVTHYRRWLEQRYASLDALSTAHGATYASFDDVEPPRAVGQDRAALDWLDFRFQAMAERFQWHFAAVRSADRERWAMTCNHGTLFHGMQYAAMGADLELYSGVSNGYEMGQIVEDDDPDLYNLLWMETAGAQGKPLCPVRLAYRRTTPGSRGGGTSYTPNAANRYFWESVGTGAWHLGFIQWRGSLPDGEWGVKGTAAEAEIRHLLTDWHRIEHEFDDMWPHRPRVAIYCAHPTWALKGFDPAWRELHRAFAQQQVPKAWLFDGALLAGRADDYDIIATVSNRYLSREATERLADWVRQGGLLICRGPHGHVAEPETSGPEAILGPLPLETDEAGVAEGRLGRGGVIQLDDWVGLEAIAGLVRTRQTADVSGTPLRISVQSEWPVRCPIRLDTVGGVHDEPRDLSGHDWLGQVVELPTMHVASVSICTPTYLKEVREHSLCLQVRTGGFDGPILADRTVPPEEITDNSWHEVPLGRELPEDAQLYLKVIPPASLPPQTIGVWASSESRHPGASYADGRESPGDLRVAVEGIRRIPPNEALEAFLLTDGLNSIVVLANTADVPLAVAVALDPSLLPAPPSAYGVRELVKATRMALSTGRELAARADVPAHRGVALCFERRTSEAEAREALGQAEASVRAWRRLAAATPYVEATLTRAEGYLKEGRHARSLAASLRLLRGLGLHAEPADIQASSDGVLMLEVRPLDTAGKPVAGAKVSAELVPLFGHRLELEEVAPGRYRLAIPVRELPWRYDYEKRQYRPYDGPIDGVITAQAGAKTGQATVLGTIAPR